MKTGRLNSWLTLGANIGVLIGIILLLVELDQNRQMMRAQTRNVLSGQLSDFLLSTASDKDMSELKIRAEAGDDLSAEEERRYLYHFAGNVRIWEKFTINTVRACLMNASLRQKGQPGRM